MINFGNNITSAADPLEEIRESDLYSRIVRPHPNQETLLRRLRILYTVDTKQYTALKKQLPYFVCAAFNPPFRRKENFAYADCFMIDIDHLSAKGLNLGEVRKTVNADTRVAMSFVSPSRDGLKVMFRLKNRCYDAGLYSIFYKDFLKRFSTEYHLEQVVDTVTCDVTRACFLSYDPEAFYREESDKVALEDYVDENNPVGIFDIKREQDEAEAQSQREAPARETDPDADVMKQIKERLHLGQRRPPAVRPPAFVPQELRDLRNDLQAYLEAAGVVVNDVIDIQYGMKIRCSLGLRMSEVNLFYGKRGFNTVISPRTGTDAEFNELTRDLISEFLANYRFQSQPPFL